MAHRFLKSNSLLILLGAAGALIFIFLYSRVSPAASVDMRYSRSQIMERTRSYLLGLGYDLKNYQQDAWVGMEGRTHLYLQTRVGMDRANEIVRSDTVPAHHWYVSWYDPSLPQSQNPETFRVWMTLGGRVLGFEHVIDDSVGRPSVAAAQARAMAEAFLIAQNVNLQEYQLKTSSDTKLRGRTDYRFVWSRQDTLGEQELWLRVQGNEVGGYRASFVLQGDFQREYGDTFTKMTFIVTASFAALFLLFFFIVVLFLRKYHEGEVGTRTAALVFIGLFAISVLSALNQYPVLGASTMIGDLNKANVRLVVFGMDVFIVQVFFSVMVFAAWSVGESSSRTSWPRKLTAVDSTLFRKFFTADVGEGILRGYAWGLGLLGLFALVSYWLTKYAGVYLLPTEVSGIAEAYVPAAQPVLAGFTGAVTCEIIYRLFFISYLSERLKKPWLAVLAAAVIWTVTAYALWSVPIGHPRPGLYLAILLLFGLAFGYLFLRYDLITTIMANFVLISLNAAIPLFSSQGAYFVPVQWEVIAFLAIPLVVAVLGLIKQQRFEFTLETMPQHIKRISERERMAKELEIARSVQMSLLPKSNPLAEGYDIAGICIPALEVGGDYYDFVSLGGSKIGIAIGDVSGKGVPAAIYMTLTKGILQSHAEDNVSPKLVLSKVNSLMYRTIERNSFVSMFYAILDLQQKTIRFARAGQCPVIFTQHADRDGLFLTPKGMALGLEMGKVFDSVLEEREVLLRSGEVLVFYTDGFTEAMNKREEEFGEKRLVEAVSRHRTRPAADLIRGICDEVKAFTGDALQHDDMTMVV
ncbi:CPBP family intramembrane metalloprotease, partial [bacterium]